MTKTKKQEKNDVIFIDINEENTFADYGCDGKLFVEETLTEKMKNLANSKPINKHLTFHFRKKNSIYLNEEEFVKAYDNTIANDIDTKKHEIGRCILTGCIMFAMSILLILLQNYVMVNLGDILYEISEIAAWVFAWAAVEVLTIELVQLWIEVRKLKRLRRADLLFTTEE